MGYEGVQVLAHAIQNAKTVDGRGIRDALASIQKVETVTGQISMDLKRNALRSAVILKVEQDGHLKYEVTMNP